MWNTTQFTNSLKSFYSQSLEQAEQLGGKLGKQATELTERFDVREHAEKLTEKLGLRENAAALAERVSEKLPPESKIVIASKKVLDWAETQTTTKKAAADTSKTGESTSAAANKPAAKKATAKKAASKPTAKKTEDKKADAKSAAAKKDNAKTASAKADKTAKTATKSAQSTKNTASVSQVVAADGDTWVVKRSDSDNVTYRTASKEAAISRATRIAKNNGRTLVVLE